MEAQSVQAGQSRVKLPATIEGDAVNIIFNYKYLLDGLQHIPTDEAIIELGGVNTPGLVKPVRRDATDDQQFLYLIMPIKQ